MPETTVVNIRDKGAVYDLYIGRPVRGWRGQLVTRPDDRGWGNPYVIGRDGPRAEVIAKFEAYVCDRPDLMARLPELRGLVLGCWCAPLACHGDVLARLADALPEGPP